MPAVAVTPRPAFAPPEPPAPEELLLYLAAYRVVVCKPCMYALQPTGIAAHLRDTHNLRHLQRRPLLQFVSRLNLAPPAQVHRMEIVQFPVPGLSVQDGLRCEAEGCTFLCASAKRMKNHWYTSHRRPGRTAIDWSPTPLQTLFRGNLLRLTLATDSETQALWHITVPHLAYQYPFLLHGLLACAGLHLAYLYPDKASEYNIAARSHQDIALPLFRSTIAKVDSKNCHACLAFSHLLVIYTWASERQEERLLLVETDSEDVLPPWLYFIRSGCSLLCHVWEDILAGPVKSLASQWDLPIERPQAQSDLVIDLMVAIPNPASPEGWTEEETKIYRTAAIDLGAAFATTPPTSNYTTWDALRIWPMYTSVDFFQLLQRWHPGALILLAHFCILLQRVEMNWYFEGRASRLLSTILKHLDPRWHRCIKWPLEEILPGMVSE